MTLHYFGSGGQGTQGPQRGTGRLAVAEWWLEIECVVAEDSETAAAPVRTMQTANARTISFMEGGPFRI